MSLRMHPLGRAGRVLVAALSALALGTPAAAYAGGDAVWAECVAGQGVSTRHTQSEFRAALTNPPADGAEYSDCEDQIRAAQIRAARGGDTSKAATGTGSGGGGTSAPPAVQAAALKKALSSSGIDPAAAPAGSDGPAPAPVVVAGKSIDLQDERQPSVSSALALPLPLALSAIVVLLSAILPLLRYLVVRFGGAQGGGPDGPAGGGTPAGPAATS